MPPRRWIVPLVAAEPDGPAIIVEPSTDGQRIQIHRRDHEGAALPQLEPLTACQLGQALLDASAFVGQQRAKRNR